MHQYDLYFTVQWFCLISWRPFDVWTLFFGIMNQYDPRFDLKINVGHCDLYFMVQWFCLVSWRQFDVWTSFFWIMNQFYATFGLKIIVCHWPIFHGPVILCYILKTIWYMNSILQDYASVWPDIVLKLNVGHCDIYFMVQWFCLISWRLFDVWTSYFRIIGQYDQTFDLKVNVSHCDLYFMVQWFCHI